MVNEVTRLFVDRPIAGWAAAIAVVVLGAVAVPSLPVQRLPDAEPTSVVVSARYPGAGARLVADAVAAPIEVAVAGLDRMVSMSSQSDRDGGYQLTVTFEPETDPQAAAAGVQARLATALPRLPEEVRRWGVATRPQPPGVLLLVNVGSPNGRCGEAEVCRYAATEVKEAIARVPGVGHVELFGADDCTYRIRLEPDRLAARDVTALDAIEAIRRETLPVAGGQTGVSPAEAGEGSQYPVNVAGPPSDVTQFEDIVLKADPRGRVVQLGDVARVEASARSDRSRAKLNLSPSVVLAVYRWPRANAVEVARNVREKVADLSRDLPRSLACTISYDTTRFTLASTVGMLKSLGIGLLVLLVVLHVFLQDIRATLIAVGSAVLVLAGTLAVMRAAGLTINTFSLFGLLAGLAVAVHDAVLAVEAAMRHLLDEAPAANAGNGKAPRKLHQPAAIVDSASPIRGAMREVAAPIAATGLILLALFVPFAAVGGIAGRFLRDFCTPAAVATVLSSAIALTLLPAFCSTLLRPRPPARRWYSRAWSFGFEAASAAYRWLVGGFVRRAALASALFVGVLVWTAAVFREVPAGFLPVEDQGCFVIDAQLPDGSTLERTLAVSRDVEQILLETPEVSGVVSIAGYSVLDNRPTTDAATFFILLDDWSRRQKPASDARHVIQSVQAQLDQFPQAACVALAPPLAATGDIDAFKLWLQADNPADVESLQADVAKLVERAGEQTAIARLQGNQQGDLPQYRLEVDRLKAGRLDVPPDRARRTLQACLAGDYVGDSHAFGSVARVEVRADAPFASRIEDVGRLRVRNASGEPILLAALLKNEPVAGPNIVTRCDGLPATVITGTPRAGYAAPQTIAAVEQAGAAALTDSSRLSWDGLYGQIRADGRTYTAVALAALFMALVVAVYTNSWTIPLAVVLSMPTAILGALGAASIFGFDVGLYTAAGLLLVSALASKDVVCTVALAGRRRALGCSIPDAAAEAASVRFRAIVVTGASLGLAMVPLVVAGGAGAASLRIMATTALGGVASATILGLFFTPVLYAIAQWFGERAWRDAHGPSIWFPADAGAPRISLGRFARRGPKPEPPPLQAGQIYTVTGPISPFKLRTTLAYEHVMADSIGALRAGRDRYDVAEVFARMLDYLQNVYRYGGRSMVECTPALQGRDPTLLKRLSEASGVQILTNTGYSGAVSGKFLPPEAIDGSADDLAERWVGECRHGIEDTAVRPGFIRIGVDAGPLSEVEQKLVSAAARTHLQTGLTIVSHSMDGQSAMEQLAMLCAEGVDPGAWVWAHAQAEPQRAMILEAARQGAWVVFDSIRPETVGQHVALIRMMHEHALLGRVMISQNNRGYQVGEKNGGKVRPYDVVFKQLIPALFNAGFNLKQVEQLTVVNPMQAFAVRVRKLAGAAAR